VVIFTHLGRSLRRLRLLRHRAEHRKNHQSDADANESVTFRFEFSSPERTLSKAELTPTTDAIIAYLESIGLKFKAI